MLVGDWVKTDSPFSKDPLIGKILRINEDPWDKDATRVVVELHYGKYYRQTIHIRPKYLEVVQALIIEVMLCQ